ncbi:uncharacterized protein LOC121423284 [Lytechinus variegatus]|uniref:uncharacterized protein LOC121423284 n=1 Tax=Lytechinus variegatus TaxID=7654 RepID=UPI001BB28AB9|nr:uncharacterized protein LOC121423284 [Lytechinus variegatus]
MCSIKLPPGKDFSSDRITCSESSDVTGCSLHPPVGLHVKDLSVIYQSWLDNFPPECETKFDHQPALEVQQWHFSRETQHRKRSTKTLTLTRLSSTLSFRYGPHSTPSLAHAVTS